MNKKQLAALTPEEVQALTGKDLEDYNKMILEGTPAKPAKAGKDEEEVKPTTPKEIGDDYFKRHPESELTELHITSDGVIFPGTPRGENAAYNYKRDKKNAGVEMEVTKYTK